MGYYILETDPRKTRLRRRGRLLLWLRGLLPLAACVALSAALGVWWLFPLLYLPVFGLLRPVMEWLSVQGAATSMLPRMDLSGQVPDHASTLVAVSCLVPKPDGADELCEHLEALWRGCGVGNIRFGLLADLKQAELPRRPEDAPAIEALARGIERLNRKHGDHFYLFVRPRVMVATQNAYAGWERKRGAISQLVGYIKGEPVDFLRVVGDLRFLPRVKYIIALDADTKLQMDAAAELVAIAEHPLNRPVVDRGRGVVTAGYGIVAPRIETDIHSAGRTILSRIMTGVGGVSAYDTVSGNFYADCFGRGIFAGKGLIDVEGVCRMPCLGRRHPAKAGCSATTSSEGGISALRPLPSDVAATDGLPGGRRCRGWLRSGIAGSGGTVQNILWLSDSGYRTSKGVRRNPFGRAVPLLAAWTT